MRKLFRMKFEKCSGQCYDHDDVMRIHTLGLDVEGTVAFLQKLLAMHAPSCGNESIQFRLDVDEFKRRGAYTGLMYKMEDDQRFVASFYHYGTLDLFSGDTALEAMDALIDGALAWYQSDEGVEKLGAPVDRSTACHHGTDEKLVNFALEFSGLDQQARDLVRQRFA